MFGHLKINRAIATPYDKLAERFLGMLLLAAFSYWCKFIHRAWDRSQFYAQVWSGL